MGEPQIPSAADRGHARDLAEHILDRIRNDEPALVPSVTQVWLLASTLKFYIPILEAAYKVANHWRDQEGISAALLDDLVGACYGE